MTSWIKEFAPNICATSKTHMIQRGNRPFLLSSDLHMNAIHIHSHTQ